MRLLKQITLIIGIGAALALGTPSHAQYTAQTDPGIREQTWEGWGTSLAWWANVIGGYSDNVTYRTTRQNLIQGAFGDTGLRLNIARYNIGGGENPNLNVNNIEYRARIPGYLAGANAAYNWTQDANQRYTLQQAITYGANRFEAFSNSPPYWMTVSGTVRGAGDGGNNLQTAYYATFAQYLTDVVAHFKTAWGITFDTVAPMNEPSSGYWNSTTNFKQEGCGFLGTKQSDLIELLGAKLKKAGLTTTVSAADETNTDQAYRGWDSLRATAKAYATRLNTHVYNGGSEHWVNSRAAQDRKRLWVSEYGDGDATGMTLAQRIITDLKVTKPTAWCYWQVVDGGYGWGCVDVDLNNRKTNTVVNRKYYMFGQFTRFIRPGAIFLPNNDPNSVSAYDPAQNRLIIVTLNPSKQAQTVTHNFSYWTTVGSSAYCYTSDQNTRNWAYTTATVSNSLLKFTMPPQSVNTFSIAATYTGTQLGGYYRIRNVASQQAINVPAFSAVWGTPYILYAATTGYNEQFRVEGTGDGRYKLCNRANGLYFAADYNKTNPPLMQWEDGSDSWRNWYLQTLGGGAWRFTNSQKTSLALTDNLHRNNGVQDAYLALWGNSNQQRWWFDYQDTLYP